jgi:WD40 repeat protein
MFHKFLKPLTVGAFAIALNASAALPIAKLERKSTVDFEKEILPVLRANCLACHNTTKAKAGLNLETPQLILVGGDSGPATVPGKSAESILFKSASHADDPVMPPKGNKSGAKNLAPAELALLKLWIDQGAKGEVKGFVEIKWQPLAANFNPIYSVALSDDGQFAAANRGNRVHIYHLPTQRLVSELSDSKINADKRYAGEKVAHHDMAYTLKFSPDGKTLVTGSYQEVKFWRQGVAKPALLAGGVTAKLAASADGNRFAIGEGSSVRVFDVLSKREIKTLSITSGTITSISLASDGNQVAAASSDNTIRVWSVSDGKLVTQIKAPSAVATIAIFGSDDFIAGAGTDKVIRTWKIATAAKDQKPVKELKGHTDAITSLAGSSGNTIVSGSKDQTVRSWDAASGKELKKMSQGARVSQVSLSGDAKLIASLGEKSPSAKLWTAADGKLVKDLKGDFELDAVLAGRGRYNSFTLAEVKYHEGAVKTAEATKKKTDDALTKANEARDKLKKEAPAKDKAAKAAEAAKAKSDQAAEASAKLLAAAKDAKVKAAAKKTDDAAKKAKADAEKKLIEAQKPVQAYRNSIEQAKRAVVDVGRAVKAVEKAQGELAQSKLVTAKSKTDLVDLTKTAAAAAKNWSTVSFSGDSQYVALLDVDGTAQLFRSTTGTGLSKHSIGAKAAMTFAGNELVSHAAQTSLKAVEPQWTLARTIGTATGKSPITGRVYATAFSPDGKLLATGSGDTSRSGQLVIWNAITGAKVQEIYNSHSDIVLGLDFSRDGKWLASGAADKFAKVWEVSSGKKLFSFEGHTHQVMDVDLKPDMRTLLSAGADGIVKVWNLVTGEAQFTVKGYTKEITSLQFIGYEAQFLATTAESHVRFLDERGRAKRSFAGAKDFVNSAAATPDGKIVIAGGQDGVLHVWNGADGKLIKAFPAPIAPAKIAKN